MLLIQFNVYFNHHLHIFMLSSCTCTKDNNNCSSSLQL